jgi:polyphosphate kinase
VTDATSTTETVAEWISRIRRSTTTASSRGCQFNERVLELAEDRSNPLLDAVKFCAIYSSNLDEFLMVAVAACTTRSTPASRSRCRTGARRRDDRRDPRCRWRGHPPAVAAASSTPSARRWRARDRIVGYDEVTRASASASTSASGARSSPCLDAARGRPRPAVPLHLEPVSSSLGVIVATRSPTCETFARVKVPKEMLPAVPGGRRRATRSVPLEELIAGEPRPAVPGAWRFSTTRLPRHPRRRLHGSDEADDLLQAVEDRAARRGASARPSVEVAAGMSAAMREQITRALEVEPEDVFEVDGLLDLNDLWDDREDPRPLGAARRAVDAVTQPLLQADEDEQPDVLAAMRKRDILLHHPYDSFVSSVERFVEQASTTRRARDQADRVPHERRLAARPRADPRRRARQAGVCLVEVKARFDERANIQWGARWRRRACTSSTACRR